jgi:hypothetical protein
MLTTIDIPESLRNQKIQNGMTWLGVIKLGLTSGSDKFKLNELEEENKELTERLRRMKELLDKYVKLSQQE